MILDLLDRPALLDLRAILDLRVILGLLDRPDL